MVLREQGVVANQVVGYIDKIWDKLSLGDGRTYGGGAYLPMDVNCPKTALTSLLKTVKCAAVDAFMGKRAVLRHYTST